MATPLDNQKNKLALLQTLLANVTANINRIEALRSSTSYYDFSNLYGKILNRYIVEKTNLKTEIASVETSIKALTPPPLLKVLRRKEKRCWC
jgi:hypothetical protein